nr:hypothetical protein BaRGS_015972 [Batillaria attramentaria]
MVDKCPLEADDDLVRMCECDLQGHWNFTQPVTDPSTSLTYKNRYCAECNCATSVVPWQLTVTGKTSTMNDLVTMPAEELYHAALSGVTPLTVSYNPP